MIATVRRLLWPVLGLALAVFLVAVVFPTRTNLSQRDEIASAEEKLAILTAENSKLDARVEQLHTDREVERLAREQYNLVRPGEEAYAILPGPTDPEHDIFIQQIKLKNTLREWMGEEPVTHSEA